jgi:hypothetical protein
MQYAIPRLYRLMYSGNLFKQICYCRPKLLKNCLRRNELADKTACTDRGFEVLLVLKIKIDSYGLWHRVVW